MWSGRLRFYRAVEWCWENRHRCPLTILDIVDEALEQIETQLDTGCTCGRPVQIWLVTRDLTLVEVNDAAADYAGRPPCEIRGCNLGEIIMPHNVPLARGMVEIAREEGEANGFTRDRDGALLTLHARWIRQLDLFWLVAGYCCEAHSRLEPAKVVGA